MDVSGQVFEASIGGSVELLTISGAGAFLAWAGFFGPTVSSSMSKALYMLFIPSLVFGSVLDTVHSAIQTASSSSGDSKALQDLWVPVVLALAIFAVTAVIAFPLTRLIAFNKHEAVRRAIFACLILGNANTMPLLAMQSLCTTFPAFENDPKCYTKAMGYASLYMTVVNIVAWTALFQYLLLAPDSSDSKDAEQISLIESGQLGYGTANASQPITKDDDNKLKEAINRALLSPPFLTVLAASALAFIPSVPEAFLTETGPLRPLLLSVNTIGEVVVPVSCMIVGAELYRSFEREPTPEKIENPDSEESFGTKATISILFTRMVLLPLVGRIVYRYSGIAESIANPELGIFTLSQWNVPTANNTVIMVSIAADSLPRIGKQLREDVSRCVFWQFLATPIFLTLNTAAALDQDYVYNAYYIFYEVLVVQIAYTKCLIVQILILKGYENSLRIAVTSRLKSIRIIEFANASETRYMLRDCDRESNSSQRASSLQAHSFNVSVATPTSFRNTKNNV